MNSLADRAAFPGWMRWQRKRSRVRGDRHCSLLTRGVHHARVDRCRRRVLADGKPPSSSTRSRTPEIPTASAQTRSYARHQSDRRHRSSRRGRFRGDRFEEEREPFKRVTACRSRTLPAHESGHGAPSSNASTLPYTARPRTGSRCLEPRFASSRCAGGERSQRHSGSPSASASRCAAATGCVSRARAPCRDVRLASGHGCLPPRRKLALRRRPATEHAERSFSNATSNPATGSRRISAPACARASSGVASWPATMRSHRRIGDPATFVNSSGGGITRSSRGVRGRTP